MDRRLDEGHDQRGTPKVSIPAHHLRQQMPTPTPVVTLRHLAETADRCVRCGLCLPHCPTYRLNAVEGESPRGRIALIQGWAEGAIPGSPALLEHLGNCLECLACEHACPTLVPFGQLMDATRAVSTRQGSSGRRAIQRAWLGFLASRRGAPLLALAGRLYHRSGLSALMAGSNLLSRPGLAAMHRLSYQFQGLPRISSRGASSPTTQGQISLFLGCLARSGQAGAIEASLRVLRNLGYAPRIPNDQGCCGAMHRHNGLPECADRRLNRNVAAFAGSAPLGLASACVAELRTHPELGAAQDICRFLADQDWPATIHLTPLPLRVAIHVPCSQRNRLRDEGAAMDLLRRIPAIEIVELADNAFCCGAAGTYLLERPALSRALLQPKLTSLITLKADILVTTNTGCALHLAAGIREAGSATPVMHPVELIARQMTSP